MNNNAWKEFGLNSVRNVSFIDINNVLSSMHCEDGSKLARPGKFSNEIENYLIASNTFVSINPNHFFVSSTFFSLFRQLKSTTKCAFFVIIVGDHTKLAYNSICILISKSVHVLANHNYFMSN